MRPSQVRPMLACWMLQGLQLCWLCYADIIEYILVLTLHVWL